MSAHINTFFIFFTAASLGVSSWTYLRFLPRKPGPMPYPCCLVQPDQMPSADLCSASTSRNDILISQSLLHQDLEISQEKEFYNDNLPFIN